MGSNANFILIFVCLIIGSLLRGSPKFSKASALAFNSFVIWISLPALVLVQIPKLLDTLEWSAEILIPVSMAWILFLLSFMFFYFVGRKLKWKMSVIGALILTAGLGNTSFVGLPLLEALIGPEAIPYGILVDQPGTFLVLSTLGLLVAAALSPTAGRKPSIRAITKNIACFPPFVALIIAIVWWQSGWARDFSQDILQKLAATLVPLALVAVGLQLKISTSVIKRQWKFITLGLTFKLILAPLFFAALYLHVLSSNTFSTQVTVLESAMAPMITAGVVAEEFGFDADIANLMLGIGIPLSLLTVYLWNQLLFV